jgi:hypothetical protein
LVTFSEENRLKVFENRVVRKILGPKRDEIKGNWRILHKRGLLTKCYLGDQIKKNGMGGRSMYYVQERENTGQNFGGEN